jgi:hypothetical protein
LRKNERREEGGSDFVFTTDLYNLCCICTHPTEKKVVLRSDELEKGKFGKIKDQIS